MSFNEIVDLTDKISHAGTVSSRGEEAVSYLKNSGKKEGVFRHNNVNIYINCNSTVEEMHWQFVAKTNIKMFGRI